MQEKTTEGTAERRIREQAFIKGALAIRTIMQQEVKRLETSLVKGVSDFERGQLDGIFWLQSCIEEVFGIE